MHDQLSIQNFYGRTAKNDVQDKNEKLRVTSTCLPESEFSSQEPKSTNTLSSMPRFKPRGEYSSVDIGDIQAGPGSIKIVGRIVNLMRRTQDSGPDGRKAAGFIKMCIRDDTGIITVSPLIQSVKSSYINKHP